MHLMLYFLEMLRQRADGLETLRQRATCPVCKEFYTTPKRLDCSHVFCRDCLKRHLQAHSGVNFPPCPMCRRPIRKSYREVTSLEPARAEEEIVDFVRQFEVCGLCQQKENPSVKCIDCEFLLCDDCRKCHDMMKPNHIIVTITSCDEINQYSNLECAQHANPMDKFCIMCERPLCVLCDWFEHEICKRTWDDHHVQAKYRKGFLSHFIHCISLTKWSHTQIMLPRIVHLHAIVCIGRHWQVRDSKRLIEKRENKDDIPRLCSKNASDITSLKTLPGRIDSFEDVLRLQEVLKLERVLEARERTRISACTFFECNLKLFACLFCALLFNIVRRPFQAHGEYCPPLTICVEADSLATEYIESIGVWVLLEIYIILYRWLLIRNVSVVLRNELEDPFRTALNPQKIRRRLFSCSLQITITWVIFILCLEVKHYRDIHHLCYEAAKLQFIVYCFEIIHHAFVRILYVVIAQTNIIMRHLLHAIRQIVNVVLSLPQSGFVGRLLVLLAPIHGLCLSLTLLCVKCFISCLSSLRLNMYVLAATSIFSFVISLISKLLMEGDWAMKPYYSGMDGYQIVTITVWSILSFKCMVYYFKESTSLGVRECKKIQLTV